MGCVEGVHGEEEVCGEMGWGWRGVWWDGRGGGGGDHKRKGIHKERRVMLRAGLLDCLWWHMMQDHLGVDRRQGFALCDIGLASAVLDDVER